MAEAAARVPAERDRDEQRLAAVRGQVDNLVAALADGTLSSAAVRDKLRAAETEADGIERRLAAVGAIDPAAVRLPDEGWVRDRLAAWAAGLADPTAAAAVLRAVVEDVRAEAVVAPGKTRGYVRLRLRVRAWGVRAAAVCDHLPAGGADAASPEFVLDLGGPTEMDKWAQQIAAWRTEGMPWKEIVERTGLDLNRAYREWKRYTQAAEESPAEAA